MWRGMGFDYYYYYYYLLLVSTMDAYGVGPGLVPEPYGLIWCQRPMDAYGVGLGWSQSPTTTYSYYAS